MTPALLPHLLILLLLVYILSEAWTCVQIWTASQSYSTAARANPFRLFFLFSCVPAFSSLSLLSSANFLSVGLDSQSVLQHFGKGKPIPAVIEAASSGASLRATLLPEHYFVSVMLVGIVCPSMNRRPAAPTGAAAGAPASQAAPAAAEEGGEPATNGHAGTILANSRGVQSVLQLFICDLTELTCTSKGSVDWSLASQCNSMLVVIPNPWLDAVSF